MPDLGKPSICSEGTGPRARGRLLGPALAGSSHALLGLLGAGDSLIQGLGFRMKVWGLGGMEKNTDIPI